MIAERAVADTDEESIFGMALGRLMIRFITDGRLEVGEIERALVGVPGTEGIDVPAVTERLKRSIVLFGEFLANLDQLDRERFG